MPINKKKQKGALLIEVLIVLLISAIMLPALFNGLFASRQGKAQEGQRIAAVALLVEAEEAVRSVREKGWNEISINGIYHPVIIGTTWSLSGDAENIDGLTRKIEIQDVFRDPNGIILENGGILDPSTKKISITVSWELPYSSSVNSIIYLTRYLNNKIDLQSTFADFVSGTISGTTVVNNNGGEVVLGAGGNADWCAPNLSIQSLDLPKSSAAKAVTAIFGEAFAGTGQDSSGESLVDVSITDTKPPVASIINTADGYKTNDVFGEQNYAYVATDTNSKEVVIINIASTPFTEVGSFNASGSEDGESVFILDNVGYLIQDDTLWNFNLTSKTGSRPAIDLNGVNLGGDGKSVYVVGNYAYVATTSDTSELQIIDVLSNPSSMQIVGSANLDSGDGTDIFVNTTGTRAYVSTKSSSSQKEFFIIDTSTKIGVRPTIGSYETNGMDTRAVEVVPGNKAIIVGSGGEEYQVVNTANESNPVRCGGLQINTTVFDSASVLEPDSDAYAYVVTGDSDSEFKIIEGGPGGQFSTSGTFVSKTFDAGAPASFNRFIPSFEQPIQTTIKFQVAVAAAINNSCAGVSFSYLGPDGTGSTFFTGSSQIPLISSGNYQNPGQCFSYKAYLSTLESTLSPTLYDATVNYSP